MLIQSCPLSVTIPITTTIVDDDSKKQQKQKQYPLSIAIMKGIEWIPILKEIVYASMITTTEEEGDIIIDNSLVSSNNYYKDDDDVNNNNINICTTKDEKYNLYMFMLAAVNDWNNNTLDTIYNLLRMFPEVIK